eukprot:222463_1
MDCPAGSFCNAVKRGLCKNYHPTCKNGIKCKFLMSRQCKFFHPTSHFLFIDLMEENDALRAKLNKSQVQIRYLQHECVNMSNEIIQQRQNCKEKIKKDQDFIARIKYERDLETKQIQIKNLKKTNAKL